MYEDDEQLDMVNIEGVCKYCGEKIPVLAIDQIDANIKAVNECHCGGEERAKKREALKININRLFGSSDDLSFRPVMGDQLELIHHIAEAIFDDVVSAVTIDMAGVKVKISQTTKGKIKIERSEGRRKQFES